MRPHNASNRRKTKTQKPTTPPTPPPVDPDELAPARLFVTRLTRARVQVLKTKCKFRRAEPIYTALVEMGLKQIDAGADIAQFLRE